ncbi:MAG: ABC transporter substrate-binding protein [Acidimicrobiales bacterium]|nr:MAG: ABC transporter substrate-binding protein [Acidimicrobiales bacterium]
MAVAVLLFSAGCGVAGGGDGETVRVYSGRHYDLERAFEVFADETGVDVEFLFGNDAELRERIQAEGEDTQADLFITVDAGNLATAAEQGLFRPVRSRVLEEAIPENLRDPEGRWYGLSIRARTIMYNPENVSESELSTYEDLADPRWRGRLCLRTSANVYTQSLVASLIAHHGREEALRIVRGWAENARIMSNDVEILESIAEGVCDVGITNHYYLARLYEEDPDFPVRPFWANQEDRGVHVNISGAGVTRDAENSEAALRLLEWLATDGQEVFVAGNHEYPANPSVRPDRLLRDRFGDEFRRDELDAARFGGLNSEAIELMDEAGYR